MSAPTTSLRERLLALVAAFPSRRLAVVGDLIVDEFLYGRIARVSREAPVLVLEHEELVTVPGGAANAAHNLLALGCGVRVVGAVGRDRQGQRLLHCLRAKRADVADVARVAGYATPVKTRILAGAHHSAPQQVVRVDRLGRLEAHASPTAAGLASAAAGCDGVVLSDYGYGAVRPEALGPLRAAARHARIPIVLDSRFRLAHFSGLTSATPNITELEAASGVAIDNDARLLRRVGLELARRRRLGSLLVTQGRFGMTLLEPGRAPLHIPIYGSDEVADVTGAGDTVIATFTLALACGASPPDAARLANYAAGLVVMKRGTATVSRAELAAAVAGGPPNP